MHATDDIKSQITHCAAYYLFYHKCPSTAATIHGCGVPTTVRSKHFLDSTTCKTEYGPSSFLTFCQHLPKPPS